MTASNKFATYAAPVAPNAETLYLASLSPQQRRKLPFAAPFISEADRIEMAKTAQKEKSIAPQRTPNAL